MYELGRAERELPIEVPSDTVTKIVHLMGLNHQNLPGTEETKRTKMAEQGGLIQLRGRRFNAVMFGLSLGLVLLSRQRLENETETPMGLLHQTKPSPISVQPEVALSVRRLRRHRTQVSKSRS